MKASITSEREALARSSQQAMSFASTEARYQQQLASLKAHDVRIRETLRSLRWPKAHMHFDVLVQFFIIVGCTGGQRINIIVASTDTPVSECRLY